MWSNTTVSSHSDVFVVRLFFLSCFTCFSHGFPEIFCFFWVADLKAACPVLSHLGEKSTFFFHFFQIDLIFFKLNIFCSDFQDRTGWIWNARIRCLFVQKISGWWKIWVFYWISPDFWKIEKFQHKISDYFFRSNFFSWKKTDFFLRKNQKTYEELPKR